MLKPKEQQQHTHPKHNLEEINNLFDDFLISRITGSHHLTFIGKFFFKIELILNIVALYSSGATRDISWVGNSVLNLFDKPNLDVYRENIKNFHFFVLMSTYMVTSPIPRTIIGSCSVVSGGTSSDKSSTYIASKSVIIHARKQQMFICIMNFSLFYKNYKINFQEIIKNNKLILFISFHFVFCKQFN